MAFQAHNTENLLRIAADGAGLRFGGTVRARGDLLRIAVANNGNARLYLTSMSNRALDGLLRIGAAGKVCVVFED